jgi:hypothetical protein
MANAQSPLTYYVDCAAGNDANAGTATPTAWKSITKANKAPLKPGDKLLFKRDCAWQGPLTAAWNGSAALPIVIGAYGTGNLPKIQDSYSSNIQITGSYQIIEYIETLLTTPPAPDPSCNNQPVGWKLGFAFGDTSSYNTVRFSKASKLAIGFFFGNANHHNKILNNTIIDNTVVWKLSATSADGPAGVILHGDSDEIAYNYFSNNSRICTINGLIGGISIELYGARKANIHHNISNDTVFSELGSDSTNISADNVFAYNQQVIATTLSSVSPRFIITRGAGSFGPVWRTKAYNNTVYLAGNQNSKGITCDHCGSDVLTVKNNILWVDKQPISSDGPFIEENNILWSSDGKPLLGFIKSLSSLVANPLFVNGPAFNFHLQSTSPGLDKGSNESVLAGYISDLDRATVPQSTGVDMGAFELSVTNPSTGTPAPSPTPGPSPTQTPSPTPVASPTPAPIAACTISINGGALYTGASTVHVRANVPNATQLMVGADAGFMGATWQPYQAAFDWTLPDTGNRIATLLVYARFLDGNGQPLCGGGQMIDDIIYDPLPPTLTVTAAPAASAAQAGVAGNEKITLSIVATDQDNGSGIAEMQISLDGAFNDPDWQPFAPSVRMDVAPNQTISVRVRDGGGNISPVATVAIQGEAKPAPGLFLPQITR